MTRLIRWTAQWDERVAPGWPNDGRRAARTLLEAGVGGVAGIAVIYLIVAYGVGLFG